MFGMTVTLTGTVFDAQSGVTSVEVFDGPVSLGFAEVDSGVIPHVWSFDFVADMLREYQIIVIATDGAGNESREATSVPEPMAGASGDVVWGRHYGKPGYDDTAALAIAPDGSAYVVGRARGTQPTDAYEVLVAKFGATGELIWIRELGPGPSYGAGVVADDAGGVLVAGTTNASVFGAAAGDVDGIVMKYSSEGELLWGRQYGTSEDETITAVAGDGSGGIIVVGNTEGSLFGSLVGPENPYAVRYSSEGEILWSLQHAVPGPSHFRGVAVDGFGDVYVIGQTYLEVSGTPPANRYEVYVARIDTTGELEITDSYEVPGLQLIEGFGIGPGQEYVIGGWIRSTAGYPNGVFVASLGPGGQVTWVHELANPSGVSLHDLTVDASGNVFIGGSSFGDLSGLPGTEGSAFVARISSDGQIDWLRQLGGSPPSARVHGVGMSPMGPLMVAGTSSSAMFGHSPSGSSDIFLAAFVP